MSQMTLSSAANSTARRSAPFPVSSSSADCPSWCEVTDHADGSPCFGGLSDIDLSLQASEFLTAALWQNPGQDTPVIGLSAGLAGVTLPDMTLPEAAALARSLSDLISRITA